MKLLVLFSAWARDDSDGSRKWIAYYKKLLMSRFPDDDKFICINCGSPGWLEDEMKQVGGALRIIRAPGELHVGSDASGYQVCLREALDVILEYDVVLFLHTKCVSYSWENCESICVELEQTIFDRSRIEYAFAQDGGKLVASRGHLPQTPPSWLEVTRAARLMNLEPLSFCFAATFTLYAVSALCLAAVLRNRPSIVTESNLVVMGFDRFFFEGTFASLLAHQVAAFEFLGGAEFMSGFCENVSADAYPCHNSKMVLREFERFQADRSGFVQIPFPYIFGSPAALSLLKIQFAP